MLLPKSRTGGRSAHTAQLQLYTTPVEQRHTHFILVAKDSQRSRHCTPMPQTQGRGGREAQRLRYHHTDCHSGSRCLGTSEIPKISAVSLKDIAISSLHHKFRESAAGQTCTYVKSRSPPPHSTPPLNQGERAASAALFLISLLSLSQVLFWLVES